MRISDWISDVCSSDLRLGPTNRWGTFPAVGLGWRLSRESFLANNGTFSNLMLRFGWGVTGNQQIPAGRIASQFGGDRGDNFYDIGGPGTSIRQGFKTGRAARRERVCQSVSISG